jgi:hypothetical protein
MAKKPLFFVQLDFNQFYREVETRSDAELCEWVRAFAKTLFFGQGACPWAQQLRTEADRSREKFVAAGIAGAAARYGRNSDANGNANSDANGDATNPPNSRREEKRREEKTTALAVIVGGAGGETLPAVAPSLPAAAKRKKKPIEERMQDFGESLRRFSEKYPRDMLSAFYRYWSEPTLDRKMLRFEKEITFEVSMRLVTWAANESKFGNNRAAAPAKSFKQQEQEAQAAKISEIENYLKDSGITIGGANGE